MAQKCKRYDDKRRFFKSNWLTIENEHSAHGQQNGTSQST